MRDTQYEEHVISEVKEGENYFTMRFGGWSFDLSKDYGVKPEAGQTVRLYGKGAGSMIRGVAVDGEVAYYRTPGEQDAWRGKKAREYDIEMRENFKKEKDKLDAQYEALPEVFQRRIDRFRDGNSDFRWRYEAYEMACCTEAVNIAETLGPDPENVKAFSEMPFEEKHARVPDLSEGHSGNSLGFAIALAYYYLKEPDRVPKMAGALAPLVGSEEYSGAS